MAPKLVPPTLSPAELKLVTQWWKQSMTNAFTNKLDASLKNLSDIIELLPTSALTFKARCNVNKRSGRHKASEADHRRAKQLTALSQKRSWPQDPIEALTRVKPAPPRVKTLEHTIKPTENLYSATLTKGLSPTQKSARVVFGAGVSKGTRVTPIFFLEERGAKGWKPTAERLTGAAAMSALKKLGARDRAYESLVEMVEGIIDGYEEFWAAHE